jgi:hypothetical protein
MFQKPITTASKTDALHSKKNYDEPLEIIPWNLRAIQRFQGI